VKTTHEPQPRHPAMSADDRVNGRMPPSPEAGPTA
jgi:hypothetical protein